MGKNYIRIIVHCVWTTKYRLPLLTIEHITLLQEIVDEFAQNNHCTLLALNAVHDHVHMLLQLTATIPLEECIHTIKGKSSRIFNQQFPQTHFGWQRGYGAFSVDYRNIPSVKRYIDQQQHHHCDNILKHLDPTEHGEQ